MTAAFVYVDEDGDPLFQTRRYEPGADGRRLFHAYACWSLVWGWLLTEADPRASSGWSHARAGS